MQAMFEGADADNSGSLSFAEVTELLCTEGLDTSKSFAQGMMEVFDTDRSGTIELEEFQLMSLAMEEYKGRKRARQA